MFKIIKQSIGIGLILSGFATSVMAGGTAAPVEEAACSGADTGYDKGFFIKTCDGDYSLKVKGRIQLRYAGELHDSSDAANPNADAHSFLIRRARLDFSGNVFTPKLTFDIQLDLGGIPSAVDNNILYYANMNYKVSDEFQILGGLHKINFNRQEITSDGKLQFVDRSLANERFKLDRSIGIVFHGDVWDKRFEYYLSLVNGRNTRASVNTNNELGYVARVAWNPLGEYGYEEGDIKNSQDVALTVGAAAGLWHEEATVALGNQDRVISANADMGIKYKGFSFQGEGFYRLTDPNQLLPQQTDMGFYAQAGYFIIPEHFEVAIRSSMLFDDTTGVGQNVNMNNGSLTGLGSVNDGVDETADSDNEQEYSASLSYYFKGHDIKLQTQYSFIKDGIPGADLTHHIVMAQAQLGF